LTPGEFATVPTAGPTGSSRSSWPPRPVTFSGYRWQVVLTGLAWAALVLPTVVVAWTEPVDPDDSRLVLAGPGR
jgi:hypothetical protein